jgi:hypothetical protein
MGKNRGKWEEERGSGDHLLIHFPSVQNHRIKKAKNTSKVVIIFFELPLKAWGKSKTTRDREYIWIYF